MMQVTAAMPTPASLPFIRPEELWRSLGLRANQTVVHLGCGPGFYIIPAAKLVGRGGKVIGIDIRPDMLQAADSRARRAGVEATVVTIRANLEDKTNQAVPSDSADWVLVANILHQAERAAILAEAGRISKADGTIVVIEWEIVATPLGPPAEKRVAAATILEAAGQVGLHRKGDFTPSPYHYGLLLGKGA